MTCCLLEGLTLLWRKQRWVAVATSRGTQTLDEDVEHGRAHVPRKVMITRHGEAVHRRQDCPFFVKSHSIITLRWCSHCGPNDASSKREQVMNLRLFPTSYRTVERSCSVSLGVLRSVWSIAAWWETCTVGKIQQLRNFRFVEVFLVCEFFFKGG